MLIGGMPHPQGTPEPAFWQSIHRFTVASANGTQNVVVPGLGFTPKLALFITNDIGIGAGSSTNCAGSFGAFDGASQWSSAWQQFDAYSASGAGQFRKASTDKALRIIGTTEANAVSFIPGGVALNVTFVTFAPIVTVIFFGGTSYSAKTGVSDTVGGPRNIPLGWRPDAMLFHTVNWSDPLDAITRDGCYVVEGFASFDGSTIRQCSLSHRSDGGSTPKVTRSALRDNAALCLPTAGGAIQAVTASANATSMTMTSGAGNTNYFGYIAMNFGGAAQAWAGVVNSPTATGLQSITGPGFTPSLGMMLVSDMPAVNTWYDNGNAMGWGWSTFAQGVEFCNAYQIRDNLDPTDANTFEADIAIKVPDHTAAPNFVANLDSLTSSGPRFLFTNVDGVVCKWPSLFIGESAA